MPEFEIVYERTTVERAVLIIKAPDEASALAKGKRLPLDFNTLSRSDTKAIQVWSAETGYFDPRKPGG